MLEVMKDHKRDSPNMNQYGNMAQTSKICMTEWTENVQAASSVHMKKQYF
jgi:hypothetical protein